MLALVILVGWAILITYLLCLIKQIPYPKNHYHNFTLHYFIFVCILAPLWEELAFRVIPIQIMEHLSNHNDKVLWYTIALTSVVFGWGRGHGMESLLMQGVVGFAIAIVYLKNGFCYWSAVTTHATWNALCIYLPI